MMEASFQARCVAVQVCLKHFRVVELRNGIILTGMLMDYRQALIAAASRANLPENLVVDSGFDFLQQIFPDNAPKARNF